jgi:type IV pilus biogenesis protein CpaD/CtpE
MADRSIPVLGLLVALAALGIAGCGSTNTKTTSNTGSSASAPPTQFIAQASAICQGVSAQEQPLKVREETLKKLPVAAADKEFVALAHEAATISRAAEAKLRALPRPTADAPAIQQLLQAYSAEATDASNIAIAAAHEESTPGEDFAGALAKSVAQHSAAAKRLGMGGCFGVE